MKYVVTVYKECEPGNGIEPDLYMQTFDKLDVGQLAKTLNDSYWAKAEKEAE